MESRVRFFYFADLGILIITIPSGPHEVLHLQISEYVVGEFYSMGLRGQWQNTGSARYVRGGDRGEGDTTAGPLMARGRRSDWPTLVVQAGKSQSWAGLRTKMRWWFRASEGLVSYILVI